MRRLLKILKPKGDTQLWVILLILAGISLIAVYSSIGYTAVYALHKSPTIVFLRHALYVVITFVIAIMTTKLNPRNISRIAQLGYWFSIGLLVAMLVIGGRWLKVPIVKQIQPSEIAKIFLVIQMARLLTKHHNTITKKETFGMLLVAVILIAGPVLPENLSTAILFFVTSLVMMYMAGAKKKYVIGTLIVCTVAGSALLYGSYHLFHSPLQEWARGTKLSRAETWSNRIDRWINYDPEAFSQENMARMAIADGKVFGIGIGNTVHARLMTQANNDFIFAIIVEEKGMLAGLLIFVLYSWFFMRCIKLSYKQSNRFSALAIAGMGTMIYLQAMVHIFVNIGALPVTGQTLPFISSGGTAYILLGGGFGIIQALVIHNDANTSDTESA
ncbi:MAG: FtsW/RodA/SpoVE family cell cycle protein [Bacteroidales bacterium]|nr:FtsW/RodA/SpoVE family cell cycle protein [Candidatus Colimorpha onthohippi]